jgi:hypothetical protein
VLLPVLEDIFLAKKDFSESLFIVFLENEAQCKKRRRRGLTVQMRRLPFSSR